VSPVDEDEGEPPAPPVTLSPSLHAMKEAVPRSVRRAAYALVGPLEFARIVNTSKPFVKNEGASRAVRRALPRRDRRAVTAAIAMGSSLANHARAI
jgi:hypothetical protein